MSSSLSFRGMVPLRVLCQLSDQVTAAGFSRFRRATETPFNIVYEARP